MRKIEDITHELAAIEARMSIALRVSNIGIWEWNIDNGDIIWDSNMLRLFGVCQPEYVNKDFFCNIIHPKDQELVTLQFKKSYDCDDDFEVAYRIKYNGDWKQVRMRGAVRCDKDGKNRRVIGVAFEDKGYCASANYCENAKQFPLQYSL